MSVALLEFKILPSLNWQYRVFHSSYIVVLDLTFMTTFLQYTYMFSGRLYKSFGQKRPVKTLVCQVMYNQLVCKITISSRLFVN